MQIFHDSQELRQYLQQYRADEQRIALVPTMGNLHEGHLTLVDMARSVSDHIVASIFINPLQFGAGEDLDRYPRTPQEDVNSLLARGCDCVFMPPVEAVYPRGLENQTLVHVPGLSEGHCGASRPGHFDGVATVVSKLFNLVQPDLAFFGQKDYQQLQIIRRMTADLCFPVEIIGVPTCREADGLAMSSRNSYLDAGQRSIAPKLYATLETLAERIRTGERDYRRLESEASKQLQAAGLHPDHVTICHAETLAPATADDHGLVILAAAYLGDTRLIDNMTLTL